ncbi:MAG: hypothetical protein AABW65_03050 [Nanoarchaeota archaeon]
MDKLQARLILEILGRPANHIKEALNELTKKLASEPGVKVIEKIIHEPVLVKDAKNLYTAFVEISLEFDSLSNYFGIIFAYMPSNIELFYPEKISLSNEELNQFGNKILQRLHDYDAITKNILTQKNILESKLRETISSTPDQKKRNKKAKKKDSRKKN